MQKPETPQENMLHSFVAKMIQNSNNVTKREKQFLIEILDKPFVYLSPCCKNFYFNRAPTNVFFSSLKPTESYYLVDLYSELKVKIVSYNGSAADFYSLDDICRILIGFFRFCGIEEAEKESKQQEQKKRDIEQLKQEKIKELKNL